MQSGSDYEVRIKIEVNSHGDFTYSPAVKRIKPGQVVTWECPQGPFSISFQSKSPFTHLDFQSPRNDKVWMATTHESGALPGPGHFHYTVAVFFIAEGRVFQDAGCPEIIVTT